MVDEILEQRDEYRGPFAYAGDSVGGTVGLQLLLDQPDRVTSAVLLCTGARIGDAAMWAGRIGQVSVSGTSVMVSGSAERWFGPGFLDREQGTASALLHALQDADDQGYIAVCEALADFDVRDRLGEITTPVLSVAGSARRHHARPEMLRTIAEQVKDGRYVELDGVSHLAPAEAPVGRGPADPPARARASRELVRRAAVAPAWPYAARCSATPTSTARPPTPPTSPREFQEFITEYAWGGIWTRPGLDRRSRSMITLTALIARGHHEELAMHVRAARTNGLTDDEIKELILQSAIYCGVPDANTAFRIAQGVLDELDSEGDS